MDGWEEQRDAIQCFRPQSPVAHRAFAVVEWPQGAVGDRLALAAHPLRSDTWPLVQWVWRVTPSPLLLNGELARKIRRLEMAVRDLAQEETGPRRDEWTALTGLKAMRDALVFQGESLVNVDTVVLVTSTPDLLEEDVMLLLARWQALGVQVRPLPYDQQWAAVRAWGAGPLPIATGSTWSDRIQRWIGGHASSPTWEPRVTTAERAASLVWPGWGLTGDDPTRGVYVGHTAQGHPIFVDFFQDVAGTAANLLAVGSTGTGKSFWMKTVIRGLLAQGFRVVVLDVDGEYRAVCEAERGTWIDVSGTQASAFPDPLAIPAPVGDEATDARRWDRMLDTVGRLTQILGDFDLVTKSAVERAVITVWKRYGVSPEDPATWTRTPHAPHPTMAEVWEQLNITTEDPDAMNAAKRLWVYIHGSQRYLFAGRPEVWDTIPSPLTVWHLGNLAQHAGVDARHLPPETAGRYVLVWHTIWEWLRRQRRAGQWTAIVVDEGQRVMTQPILGSSVADLASTIRKWNGVMLLATNTPDPLWSTSVGQSLWATTPLKAFLRLEKAQVESAAQALQMPAPVAGTLVELPKQTVLLRLWHDEWVTARAEVPPDEARLYKTRG
ncbi:VirB4 family type IV secretion system protein [Sulfobacillus sp. hq2]|uniref:VirB4 family type IV secretion system protein n=1 Tax=Sulfobacillus TaxID=28033 RepID=UPI0013050420|nr:DUF87 domain-containing protein [Sulfobacillus sp. hq2]